jgi:hypothetical protein
MHDESEQRYREDVDPSQLSERVGRPVDRVTVSPAA